LDVVFDGVAHLTLNAALPILLAMRTDRPLELLPKRLPFRHLQSPPLSELLMSL